MADGPCIGGTEEQQGVNLDRLRDSWKTLSEAWKSYNYPTKSFNEALQFVLHLLLLILKHFLILFMLKQI